MEAKPYKIPHPFRKLSKELINTIVKDIAKGSTHKYASLSNGITPRIFDIWRKQGEVDIEHEILDSLPAYLVLSLSKIKQLEVINCRIAIRENEKGHKGAEWTLEHAYWRDFSTNSNVLELASDMDALKADLENVKNDETINRKAKKDSKK
jgi:hypothetical protein